MTIKQTKTWGRCPACKEYDFLPHRCPPSWEVRHADYDEDDHAITHAATAELAAIAYIDDGDYDGEEYELAVRPAYTDEPWKVFKVRGEMTIQFYAEDITPEPEPEPDPEEELSE